VLEEEDIVVGIISRVIKREERKEKGEKGNGKRGTRVGRLRMAGGEKGGRLGGGRGEEERKGGSLAPLLEETHPLTLAIGAPEIAAAAGAVAAVLRPVIAVAPASYASPPKQVYQRGTSTRD